MPIYSITYPQNKKIATSKNHIWDLKKYLKQFTGEIGLFNSYSKFTLSALRNRPFFAVLY